MKKYLYFLFILFLLFFISCNKREFNNKPLSIEIHIGEEYLIEPITNGIKDPKFDIEIISKWDKNYNDVISYDNFLVKGLSSGEV